MKLERVRPAVLRVTLSAYEMAALTAGARWIVEGRPGELTAESIESLRRVLEGYDRAVRTVSEAGTEKPTEEETDMSRRYIDCRDIPSDSGCTVAISADSDDELLEAAVDHAVRVHGHEDTPEFRTTLKEAFKRGTPP